MEGVEGYFDHKDVPGENSMGPIVHDEEVFASAKVTCVGQVRPPEAVTLLGLPATWLQLGAVHAV